MALDTELLVAVLSGVVVVGVFISFRVSKTRLKFVARVSRRPDDRTARGLSGSGSRSDFPHPHDQPQPTEGGSFSRSTEAERFSFRGRYKQLKIVQGNARNTSNKVV